MSILDNLAKGTSNVIYNDDHDVVQIKTKDGVLHDWKQGGLQWKYIFKDGVIDTDIATLVEFGFEGTRGSIEIGESVISITTTGAYNNGRRQGVRTGIPIDITNISKISMDFVLDEAAIHSFISLTTNTTTDPYTKSSLKVFNDTDSNGTLEYDVSNITGLYYINFGIVNGFTEEKECVINNLKFM